MRLEHRQLAAEDVLRLAPPRARPASRRRTRSRAGPRRAPPSAAWRRSRRSRRSTAAARSGRRASRRRRARAASAPRSRPCTRPPAPSGRSARTSSGPRRRSRASRVNGGQTTASSPASAAGSGPRNIFQLPAMIMRGSPPRPAAPCPRAARGSRRRRSRPRRPRSARPSSLSARTESAPPTTENASWFAATACGDRLRPAGEARPLEDAHRPVPEDRARLLDALDEARPRLRADVEAEPAVAEARRTHRRASRRRRELGRADDVDRQLDLEVERVLVAQLLGHLAADQHRVGPTAEVAQHAELVLDLRPAGDEHERALDLAEQPAEVLELGQEQQAGVGRQQVRDGLGRGVRAVRRAERVVDVEVAARRRARARSARRSSSRRGRSACSRARGRARRAGARAAAPRPAPSRTSRDPPRSSAGRDASRRAPPRRRCSSRSCSVGSEARMRVSSATRPSSSGTFRSARTSTVLSATSASRTERGTRTAPPYAPTAAGSDAPIFSTRSTSRQL